MHSIKYRITGLVFLLLVITVSLLTYLANHQMENLFEDYLKMQHMMGMHHAKMMDIVPDIIIMGIPEKEFLSSVHQSLGWVGTAILLIGFVASYTLAKSITNPLYKLSAAVVEIEKGNLEKRVDIRGKDEIGSLASGFNKMADSLATNHMLRKQLLADVAHELRTPLTIIQGNLEGMLDGVVERDDEQIHSLFEETVHLNKIITDLRDLSLAESGHLSIEREPTNMEQLITRSVQMIKPFAEEKNLTVHYEDNPSHFNELLVDKRRINQILYNLLTNAIRYTPKGGKITVNSGIVETNRLKWYTITVVDTGVGISEKDLPLIFNHFYRADKSRDRKSGGSGIGLAIVKQLVELHGGYVTVDSKLGEGSSFSLFLPVEEDI